MSMACGHVLIKYEIEKILFVCSYINDEIMGLSIFDLLLCLNQSIALDFDLF